jgi:lupus La protein
MTESSDNILRIAERLGFFFSDANLRMDKFLRNIVLNNAETGGFVPIETLLKFNTIKTISTDPSDIVAAVEKVDEISLILNDDKTAIARSEAFTKEMLDGNIKCSLRISNLPVDDNRQFKNARDEISALFQDYGKVVMVRMLTNYDKSEGKRVAFGKCFVEFHDESALKKAEADLCLPADAGDDAKPTKTLTLGDTELRIKTMQAWLDKKGKQKDRKSTEKDDTKRAREEQAAKEQEEIEQIEFKLDWQKGCVISIKGMTDGTDRETILSAVKEFMGDEVEARADYNRGDTEGAIRFTEPNDKILEFASKLNDGSVTIGGSKVDSAIILEGEAEEKYYADYIAARTKQLRARAEEKLHRSKKKRRY